MDRLKALYKENWKEIIVVKLACMFAVFLLGKLTLPSLGSGHWEKYYHLEGNTPQEMVDDYTRHSGQRISDYRRHKIDSVCAITNREEWERIINEWCGNSPKW